jgi:hypothetical protein
MTGENADFTPCPVHGSASLDQSGRCMPSCGFGWERDPLLMVRDAVLSDAAKGADEGIS